MQIPILNSKRLQLRPICLADLPEIHRLHSLPETDRYNTLGLPADEQVTKAIVEDWASAHTSDPISKHTFSVFTNEKFIGLAALWLGPAKFQSGEVWYKFLPEVWGQGYATETAKCLLEFGFGKLGLHRIEAGCAVANKASARVLEKVGMQLEGRNRKILPLAEGWSDAFIFGLLSEEFGTGQGIDKEI